MFDTFNTNYHICEEIGRGRFGAISRCFSPSKSNFFAVKTINKTLLTDTLDRECLQNEAKIMQLLSPHPNIVEIEDVFDTEENLYMVMELCEKETLYDKVVKSNGGLCEAKAASIMKQLLNGIAHCHRFGVVHRDLKPDNVLFGPRNVVKLADFGSADWIAGDDVGGGGGGESLRGVVGTPYYVAPEVIMGRDYNEKVDVWSAGVVLYVMLSGMPPFYGETVEEIFEAVARGNLRFPIRVFKNVSSGAKDLIRKMVCRDVSRRFSAEQALRHPWILNGGEETMLID